MSIRNALVTAKIINFTAVGTKKNFKRNRHIIDTKGRTTPLLMQNSH